MTTRLEFMEDATDPGGRQWAKDTLRVWFNDHRQSWGISRPGDDQRGNCLLYWPAMGGERFDGVAWNPMRRGDQP